MTDPLSVVENINGPLNQYFYPPHLPLSTLDPTTLRCAPSQLLPLFLSSKSLWQGKSYSNLERGESSY